jgi:ABC-type hemin transport system ATPase subunit
VRKKREEVGRDDGAGGSHRGLTKFYGKHLALDKLNLEVHKGEVFGFLGPKGAGKNASVTPAGQASPSMSIPGGQAEPIDPRTREEARWQAR